MDDANKIDTDIYDDEAFIGMEDGKIVDGKVLDDIDPEDEDEFDDLEEDDDEEPSAGMTGAGDLGPSTRGDTITAENDDEVSDMDAVINILPDTASRHLSRHTDSVVALDWSANKPEFIVSGGCDDFAYLWRLDSEAVQISGHTDTVACVSIDPTAEIFATGGMDGCVKLWDLGSGELKGTLQGPAEAIEWLSWHPRGPVLALGSQDMSCWMFNCSSETCMQVFSGHSGSVMAEATVACCPTKPKILNSGGFTPDGKLVVTAGGEGDGSIKVWNPKSDSTVVATGGVDGAVAICNITNGRSVAKLEQHEDSVESVVYVHDKNLLLSGSMDGKIIVWDTAMLMPRTTLSHGAGVTCLSVFGGSPLVVSGGVDGVIRVFNMLTGTMEREEGAGDVVQCVAWLSNKRVAAGSDDGIIRIYDL